MHEDAYAVRRAQLTKLRERLRYRFVVFKADDDVRVSAKRWSGRDFSRSV